MGIPMLFKEGHVLKLNKCLYGLFQAPNNFFEFLKGKLIDCGFTQSPHNPCVFMNNKVICLVYFDDCMFFSLDQADINKMLSCMKQ
eukprot:3349286-Ditylum_brightwellii.AAC.1